MNLADAIAKWANLTPAKTAVIDTTSDRRISFAELHADINRLTRGLISRGIAKGDRVAERVDGPALTQPATQTAGKGKESDIDVELNAPNAHADGSAIDEEAE